MNTIQKRFLGIEIGSTRIKAVLIDQNNAPISTSSYTWESRYADGYWTYDLDEVWIGLRTVLQPFTGVKIDAVGISAMMHGYLAFDRGWNLLVPFRTWQNTTTEAAAGELTELFGCNIPQRWSIAHLHQAILNGEPHVTEIAHITTLAGYVHFMLTGENVLGIGDASGMFPVSSSTLDYDDAMISAHQAHISDRAYPWQLRDLLPEVLCAGTPAGALTETGSELLGHLLPAGTPFAPPEGDAGTGMVATNSVKPKTGNISAGTSIFSMIVLDRPLRNTNPAIDMVMTPTGAPVAMVHCNNGTNDMNAWTNVLRETLALFQTEVAPSALFTRLYEKSLEGDADCGGVVVLNNLAGEGVTGLAEGRPLVIRRPNSKFTLANFIRAQLYSTMTALTIGMELLYRENIEIEQITGHGGLFTVPGVGQRYIAAACGVPVTCLDTAQNGGAYGMALLTAFMADDAEKKSLEKFLEDRVFAGVECTTVTPTETEIEGFQRYLAQYKKALAVEKTAVQAI